MVGRGGAIRFDGFGVCLARALACYPAERNWPFLVMSSSFRENFSIFSIIFWLFRSLRTIVAGELRSFLQIGWFNAAPVTAQRTDHIDTPTRSFGPIMTRSLQIT